MLAFFAQDTGTRNLAYANADLTKATQAGEAIAFGDPTRAFVHVHDVADAVLRACARPGAGR